MPNELSEQELLTKTKALNEEELLAAPTLAPVDPIRQAQQLISEQELKRGAIFAPEGGFTPEAKTAFKQVFGPSLPFGIAEQFAAGIGSVGEMVFGGTIAAGRASLDHAQGYDFWDSFNKNYERVTSKIRTIPYMPETESGKRIFDTIGYVFERAVSGAGDLAYELTDEPVSGALVSGQTAAILALLGVRAGTGAPTKGPTLTGAEARAKFVARDTIATLSELDPVQQTINRIEAAGVGRLKIGKARDLTRNAHAVLDKELRFVGREGGKYNLRTKFQLLIDKLDPVNELGAKHKADLADRFVDQVQYLTSLEKLYEVELRQPSRVERASKGTLPAKTKPQPPIVPKAPALTLEPKVLTVREPKLKGDMRIKLNVEPQLLPQERGHPRRGLGAKQGGAVDLSIFPKAFTNLREAVAERWAAFSDVLRREDGKPVIVFRGQWYLTGQQDIPLHQARRPREGYAVFVSDNPWVSSSFAGALSMPMGTSVVYPFVLRPKKLIEFTSVDPETGHFSFTNFDLAAMSLKPGEVLVARNVVDFGSDKVETKARLRSDHYAARDPDVFHSVFEDPRDPTTLLDPNLFTARPPGKGDKKAAPALLAPRQAGGGQPPVPPQPPSGGGGQEPPPKYRPDIKQKVDELYDLSQSVRAKSEKLTGAKIAGAFKNKIVDHASEVKIFLENADSVAGKAAVNEFNRINGSSAKAQLIFNRYAEQIWGDKDIIGLSGNKVSLEKLTREDVALLDKIIDSRRKIQIDEYKGEGAVERFGRLTGTELQDYLHTIQRDNPARFEKLNRRADIYFEAYQELLRVRLREGLIRRDQYDKLRNFDYSPTQYLEILDPQTFDTLRGIRVSVPDSGIPHFRGGAEFINNMSARELLAEHIGRLENRTQKNRANQALYNFVQQNPDNGLFRLAKVKRDKKGEISQVFDEGGMDRISVMIDGKRQVILAPTYIAEQWVRRPPAIDPLVADIARLMSGTTILKSMATTFNPEFVLVSLPMDVMHTWISDGAYSAFMPKAALQMGVDLFSVAGDAIKRGQRTQDYIMEGGGFNFLTHQGYDLFGGSKPLHQVIDPKWGKVKVVLSYVNETAELAIRLAHRERLLKQGLNPLDATARARGRLDFSIGAPVTMVADTIVPYLNASVQAFASSLRKAKRDPKRFAFQALQLATLITYNDLAQMLTNPEAWQQIPLFDKMNNFVFTTPMSVQDPGGSTRYPYFQVKLDQTTVPLRALMLAINEYAVFGKVPDDVTLQAIRSLPGGQFTEISGIFPSFGATATYISGFDFRSGRPIWSGMRPTSPELEVQGLPSEPAHEFWQFLGKTVGGSPERMEAASRYVLPNNTFTALAGSGMKWLFTGMSEYEKHMTTTQMLQRNVGFRKFMKLTHPAVIESEQLETAAIKTNDPRQIQLNALKELAFKEGKGELTSDSVKAWIRNQPEQDRERLVTTYVTMKGVETVYKRMNTEGMPSKNWWINLAGRPPSERAEVFYDKWVSMDAERRHRLEFIAGGLSKKGIGTGFVNKEFSYWFSRARQDRGEEQR